MENSVINTYLNTVDGYIKQVNALNKSKDVLRTLADRVDLLVLCMAFVERAENELLNAKEPAKRPDMLALIQQDYRISDYANRLYKTSLKVIDLFMKNADKMDKYKLPLAKRTKFLDLSKKMMNIAARWDIERFINVYEFDEPISKKAFPQRKPLLGTVIFYANRMNATKLGIRFEDGIMPTRIIFAVQPNSGKSFVVNVYSVLATVMHSLYFNTGGILRMSNNGGNACGFSNQIMSMIENEKICLVFPELKPYFASGKPKVFEKSTAEEWKMCNLNPKIRASHFARGRDSAINSLRVFVLLAIDDLSDGFDQMNNDEAHQAMTTKYNIDMKSRKESEDVPEFIVGTMFNEFDVPNTLIKKLEDKGLLIDCPDDKNVRYTKDFSTIVVQMDCFNEKGESIAPDLISTEALKDVQASLKPYEFDLVYRQVRASREPRIFEYGNLQKYKKLPKTLEKSTIGVLDPNRKSGNDFFALPVLIKDTVSHKYYFTDAIYKQKSLGKVSDPRNEFLVKVCRFIIDNKMRELTLENNTSNTLGTLLEQKLKEFGYFSCKINEIFTAKMKGHKYSSKGQRILEQEASIVNNIVFPDPSILKPNTDLANFMEDFTRYDSKASGHSSKNHDDAPDSLSIFSDKYLFNQKTRFSSVSGIKKSALW